MTNYDFSILGNQIRQDSTCLY